MNNVNLDRPFFDKYIKSLQDMYPHLELGTGYIGNYRTLGPPEERDQTVHYVWCNNRKMHDVFGNTSGYSDPKFSFHIGRGSELVKHQSEAISSGKLLEWIKRMDDLHDKLLANKA